MKFSFLSIHLFYINVFISILSIKYSVQDNEEWIKVNDVVYYGPKYVNEGQTFTIMCRMSQFFAPKWTKNDIGVEESNRISFDNKIGIEMTRIESLTVTSANANDSGYYRCNSFSRAYHRIDVITSQTITSIPESTTHSNVIFEEIKEEFSTIVLNCNLMSDSDYNETLWFKNGNLIVNDERRETQKSKLIISKATSAVDAGDYLCQIDSFSVRGGSQFGQMIQLRAPIRVKPFRSPQSIVIGSNYRLECDYTGYPFGKIRWIIGNNPLTEQKIKELNLKIEVNSDSHPDSVLIIRNATKDNKNSYTCVVDNGYSQDETSTVITVRESGFIDYGPLLLLENKPLNIFCNFTDDSNHQVIRDWTWTLNGIITDNLPEEQRNRITEDPKDHSIVITKAEKDDIGDWECKDSDGYGNPISHRIRVLARPWLQPFEEYQKTNYKSANIVEGQRLHLRCRIIEGYERYARIEWFKFNESEINNDYKELVPLQDESKSQLGRIHIAINNNRTDGTDQTLTIEKVLPSDRFYYVCRASNDVYSVNNTILLRVKDKLGALWPFLGIVAEVVILCTIIFIYEKRRIKPDFDETENDNNTEPKGTQDRSSTKPQDVRQRK